MVPRTLPRALRSMTLVALSGPVTRQDVDW